MRHERHDITTDDSEPAGEERGRTNAIDVIVAVNKDAFSAPNRLGDPAGRSNAIGKLSWIAQVLPLGSKVALRLLRIDISPGCEHRTHDRWKP